MVIVMFAAPQRCLLHKPARISVGETFLHTFAHSCAVHLKVLLRMGSETLQCSGRGSSSQGWGANPAKPSRFLCQVWLPPQETTLQYGIHN